jgi:3-methyladenine DNA glycosylase AlkD
VDVQTVLQELESLGTAFTKNRYLQQGAHEPLFGVATGAMKPLVKKIGRDQALAEALYATGNYDAMYLAGMIADPKAMTEADFDRWMEDAYFYMISDFIVAVTLSETAFAQSVADRWVASAASFLFAPGTAATAG